MEMVLNLIICFLIVVAVDLLIGQFAIWRSKRNGLSLKKSIDPLEVPIITMENGGKEYNFLLDTGSNKSHLNSRLLKSIKDYEVLKDDDSPVATGGGTVNGGGWIRMPLQYKKQSFTEDFLLLDLQESFKSVYEESGVQLHGILGCDFFRKYGFIFDFNDMVFYRR